MMKLGMRLIYVERQHITTEYENRETDKTH